MNTHSASSPKTNSGLQPDRTIMSKALTMAGLRGRFTDETRQKIPALWTRFAQHLGRVPAQVGKAAYGVCWCTEGGGFDYLAGMEVSRMEGLPSDFEVISLPAQMYAVFSHRGHVSTLCQTLEAIHREWEPFAGETKVVAKGVASAFFERYGETFDPVTGMGELEIWVPIKS